MPQGDFLCRPRTTTKSLTSRPIIDLFPLRQSVASTGRDRPPTSDIRLLVRHFRFGPRTTKVHRNKNTCLGRAETCAGDERSALRWQSGSNRFGGDSAGSGRRSLSTISSPSELSTLIAQLVTRLNGMCFGRLPETLTRPL